MENLNNINKTSDNIDKKLNTSNIGVDFYVVEQKCNCCSGDGWVFHSKGGQSGLIKDCPKCN